MEKLKLVLISCKGHLEWESSTLSQGHQVLEDAYNIYF